MSAALKAKLAELPKAPGVYMMKDGKGGVIYVGKAKSLRSRVASYFGATAKSHPKTHALAEAIRDFEVILTKNEVEALLLERTLIKHNRPRFNVLLRDDKEYPYLKVSVQDDWPRIRKVRRRADDGAVYLGPFGSATKLKSLLDLTYKIFPLIRCSPHEFETARRPCNYYHMKMCLGPCTLPVDPDEYRQMVQDALRFMQGRNKELVADLKRRMMAAAEAENFEQAAVLRDQLQAFTSVTERQSVVMDDIDDADCIGFAQNETRTAFNVLMVRDHALINSDSFVLRTPIADQQEALTHFLLQFYDARSLPRELLLPFDPGDLDNLQAALLESHPDAAACQLKIPARGPRKDLAAMATKNAEHNLSEVERLGRQSHTELSVIQEKLKLSRFPARMECIDISNTLGTAIVASDVCFIQGKPAKELYRHYTVKTVTDGPDDFASIREVVRRRLERGMRDNDLPDLLVIDGGRGQLSAAMDAIGEFKGLELEVVGLAKSRAEKSSGGFRPQIETKRSYERVVFPDRETPLPLAPGSPEYRLLTRLRDEAHRFAISHHRKKRGKISQGSELESIPGIGPTLRATLLKEFGGLDGLRKASLDQLRGIKGLREASAVALHSYLKQEKPEPSES